jgi:DNA end-binding protein Ku
MSMAIALIDQLPGEFEPGDFQDEYRVALEQVIEAKLVGTEPVIPTPVAPVSKVGDLMEALKASIEATKTERSTRKNGASEVAEEVMVEKKPAAKKRTKAKAKAAD